MPRQNEVQIILTFKDQASVQIGQVIQQINIFQTTVTGAGKGIGIATGSIAKSFRTLSRFLLGAAGIAVITRAIRNTIRAINNLADSAGELQGLERAFFGLSAAIGKSSAEMLGALEKASQGMISQRDLMKRWNLSVQLLGLQLGERMPEALEKLTLVSAATGESMDFLFDSLVRGVGRFQPRILDNLGVIIKLNETYDRFGAELGITRDQMSTLQKQTAIFNDVMEQLDRNTQALPDLAGTLTLEFARFKATLQNTKDLILRSVTPALGTLFQTFNELATRVMPTLVNVMTNLLEPALALTADAFRDLATMAADSGESILNQFGGRMRVMARNAFDWGLNIMIEFADGIIRGAVGVLTAAMNFVGNLLASWLSAGSPPKIAPNIDKWGAAALTEWLKGMENADFDVLEGVQRPLKDILNLLLSEELIDEATFNAIFKDVAFFMSKALSDFRRTGVLDTSIFDKLRAAGGAFGDELAELARRQLKLAAATREVKLAEEALEKARAQTKESKNLVKKLADEFNRLKRAGASKAILEAKRQEFLIAKKQWWLARGQIKQAEERVKTAEEAVDPLKDEVKLQERLLDQLIGLAQLQQKLLKQDEERAKKAKKGKVAKGGGVEVPRPVIPKPDFSQLNAGLEEAKNNLRAKLLDLFAPLIQKWREEWLPLLQQLAAKWQWFTGIVKDFWDKFVKPVIDDLKKFIPPELLNQLLNLAGRVVGVTLVIGALGIAITLATNPLTLFIAGAVLARIAWEKNWFRIRDVTKSVAKIIVGLLEDDMDKAIEGTSELLGTTFVTAVMDVNSWLRDKLAGAIKLVTGAFVFLVNTVKPIWKFFVENLLPVFVEAGRVLKEILLLAIDVVTGSFRTFFTIITDVWKKITKGLQPAFEKLEEFLREDVQPIIEGINNFIKDKLLDQFGKLVTKIDDGVTPAFTGLKNALQSVKNFLSNIATKIAEFRRTTLPKWFDNFIGKSPSPLELGIRGAADALTDFSNVTLPLFRRQLGAGGPLPVASTTMNFNQTINTRATQANIMRDFEIARALAS